MLSYGRPAVAELPAARPAASEQNGSAPQSGYHLAERNSRCDERQRARETCFLLAWLFQREVCWLERRQTAGS